MVKLVFLGTGGWISPLNRNYVSIVLQPSNTNSLYILDFGEGAFKRMQKHKGIKPSNIKAVFISHIHGDHALGLPGLLINLRAYGYTEVLKIIVLEKYVKFLESLFRETGVRDKVKYEIIGVKPFDKAFSDENIEAYTYPSKHSMESLMFKIVLKKEGKTVFYSSDTSPFKEILDYIRGTDILIYEATFLEGFEEYAHVKGHSTIMDALNIALELKIPYLIIFHEGFMLNLPREISIEGTKVIIPSDGDEITI